MITDRDISPASSVIGEKVDVACAPGTGLAGVVTYSYTPGFSFQLTRVRSFTRTKTGAVSFVVKVGTRTAVAAGTFTAATEVAQVLSTTIANLRGSNTEAITITTTTDGTGALADGHIVLEFRPWPVAGEAAAGDSNRNMPMG